MLFPSEDVFDNLRTQNYNLKNKAGRERYPQDDPERTTLAPTRTVSFYKPILKTECDLVNKKLKKKKASDGQRGPMVPCSTSQKSHFITLIKLSLGRRLVVYSKMLHLLFFFSSWHPVLMGPHPLGS